MHSQLLNLLIVKLNSPVMLNQVGNIFPYCPVDRAIRRINSSSIDLQGRSMLELYLRMSVLWLKLGYSMKYSLSPHVFPWALPSGFPSGSGYISLYIPLLVTIQIHSQLLNIIILKFYPPVLLNQLGNIFLYCPAVGAIRRINSSNIDLPGRSMLEL